VTKLILIVYLLPMGIMSFILFFAAGPYGIIAVLFILVIGVVGMIWSSVFGLGFLFSLAQFLQGKFELEMNDFIAGAILVYGNMVPFWLIYEEINPIFINIFIIHFCSKVKWNVKIIDFIEIPKTGIIYSSILYLFVFNIMFGSLFILI